MKTKFLLLAMLLFGAYGCSPKGDGSVSEIIVNGNKMYVSSLNDLKPDIATIPLSSLVEYCELVQLESVEDAYFNPQFTTVTDKYIGVRDRTQGGSYKLFDRSGKFLCNVGSIGRGPGEYLTGPYDDIIDDKNELVYLAPFMEDKILVYSTLGQYLKDIVAPLRLNKAKIFLSDGILTVVHMPFPDDRAVVLQFDVNTGEVLKEVVPPAHLIAPNYDGEIFSTKNASGIFDFVHTSSDTLYHFDVKNNKILPTFTMTYNTSENTWKYIYQLNKEMYITNVSKFDRELNMGRGGYAFVGFVATDLTSKTSSWIKIVNDYYGNMPVSISPVTARNGYWVHNIQPEDLMDNIETRLAERDCSESDRQALTKLLSTLEVGANNVVFIGKLKSEVGTKLW